jgi:GT2 family glycosyltransferase
MQTPVAFIIFNRPDSTSRVFEAIRQAKPPLLLVIADGARSSKPGEAEKCAATRAIIDRVDWDCEVRTNYADVNLGCGKRVSSGIDWVFQEVEEAIILEDDCLPHPSFFQFCEEMLAYYRDDSRIMAISGNNFQRGRKCSDDSYYFSRYNHVWGWASWRRAWKHYDFTMSEWPQVRDGNWLNSILDNRELSKYWTVEFEKVYRGAIDTWDYQWTFACWIQNSLTILPQVNLISNIGFNADATHTNKDVPWASQSIYPIDSPLIHPSFMLRNTVADSFTANIMYQSNPFKKAMNKLKFILIKW